MKVASKQMKPAISLLVLLSISVDHAFFQRQVVGGSFRALGHLHNVKGKIDILP